MAKAQASSTRVKWTTYCEHLKECYEKIYENNQNYDITLVSSDGRTLNVHKVVLTMSSDFFVSILKDFPAHIHPTIIIPDLNYEILKKVVNLMYRGEVQLTPNQLSDFLESFSLFQFKGLEYNDGRFSGITLRVENINPSVEFELIEESEELEIITGVGYQEENSSIELEETAETQKVEILEGNYDECYEAEAINASKDLYHEQPTSSTSSSPCKSRRTKLSDYGQRLDIAVNAVLSGKSFRSVSQEYAIPKTVLWRRASKLPIYQKVKPEIPDSRKEALEDMKKGQTLLSISEKYNIPLSTLHRDKMRLYNAGNLPDSVALKSRDKDFKQRVLKAAENCLKGIMSQSDAAKTFNLPKTTIWRRLKQLKERGENFEKVMDYSENPNYSENPIEEAAEMDEIILG